MSFKVNQKNGRSYAYEVTSKWNRETKKYDRTSKYLGVLIDRENRIYERRYKKNAQKTEKLIVSYGDAYALSESVKGSEIGEVIETVSSQDHDTLMSLLFFKLTVGSSMSNAETWYEGSYAKILYGKANLSSQRISEFLNRLGDDEFQREFFRLYLAKVVGVECGVVIDSTGLPNHIDIPLTEFGNHGGNGEEETRLIMVIAHETHTPLYVRLVAGNIVDVSTLETTIAELNKLGVKSTFSLLDGGYYSESNITALYSAKISFLTRLHSGRVLYKSLILETAATLETAGNAIVYNKRSLYVERKEIDLFGNVGYAYVCCDIKRKGIETDKFLREAIEDKISPDEMADKLKFKGKFVLISNMKIPASEIIPLYYTRQSAEVAFGIGKSQLAFLPLRVHSVQSLRGLVLLDFIALILQLQLKKLLNGKYSVENALLELRNLYCKLYDDGIIVSEPNKKQKDIFSLLNITAPNFTGI